MAGRGLIRLGCHPAVPEAVSPGPWQAGLGAFFPWEASALPGDGEPQVGLSPGALASPLAESS